jgi:hypothetical protein
VTVLGYQVKWPHVIAFALTFAAGYWLMWYLGF